MSVSIEDSPIHRIEFHELDEATQHQMLTALRERRLAPLRLYEELQTKRKEAKDDKLRGKADKLAERMRKKLEAADKALSEVEALMHNAKAIILEINVDG